ncbi:uncharacterized protein LOC142471898 [Ascaphus truei]|uniref:uncharacterized protein LOC142471898 n=1 Tax=Ascaphus truei TaxID=8439 RepID=UPI003F5AC86E
MLTHSAEQNAEQGAEQNAAQGAEQNAEQGAEQNAAQGAEQGAEQGADSCCGTRGQNSSKSHIKSSQEKIRLVTPKRSGRESTYQNKSVKSKDKTENLSQENSDSDPDSLIPSTARKTPKGKAAKEKKAKDRQLKVSTGEGNSPVIGPKDFREGDSPQGVSGCEQGSVAELPASQGLIAETAENLVNSSLQAKKAAGTCDVGLSQPPTLGEVMEITGNSEEQQSENLETLRGDQLEMEFVPESSETGTHAHLDLQNHPPAY